MWCDLEVKLEEEDKKTRRRWSFPAICPLRFKGSVGARGWMVLARYMYLWGWSVTERRFRWLRHITCGIEIPEVLAHDSPRVSRALARMQPRMSLREARRMAHEVYTIAIHDSPLIGYNEKPHYLSRVRQEECSPISLGKVHPGAI